MNGKKYKVILSGGGTGGHIYPAVAVAEALERRLGDGVEILFVGAEGKMEMTRVPALGYRIVGLPVAGFHRKELLRNLSLPAKVWRSVRLARKVLDDFGADIAVGFGGYASAPVLWSAQKMGIPTLIQEQNSYAGVTNKILARRAGMVCVAYEGMERFFPSSKISMTGNPLRGGLLKALPPKKEALEYFGLSDDRPVILVVGGSLGTRTLNEMVKHSVDEIIVDRKVQVVWQTGSFYHDEMHRYMDGNYSEGVWYGPFIERMDLAYAAADVVVTRSGACTVSELSLVGKPVIFIPSPNVAEDHQTKNAIALAGKGAALIVRDEEAVKRAMKEAVALALDRRRCEELSCSIRAFARPDAADSVAGHIIDILESSRGAAPD